MPSAVGYQPTLAAEMGDLQERITSTNKGSITSFQAVYVPADDLTDPAPATTFAHLDATVVLERSIAELGIYPAVDPLSSVSNALPSSWLHTCFSCSAMLGMSLRSSSSFSLAPPTTFRRGVLMERTMRSQKPPYHGLKGGLKFHLM